MRFHQSFALLLSGLSAASALVVPQQALDVAGQALSWTGDAAAPQSGDDVHTNTVWSYVDCGSATDAVQLKSLQVSPDPPKPGEKLTITASGTVKELIDEGAYADVVVKLGLIKLLTKRFDVCEELSNANATLQCPVQPGEYTIVQTVDLPKEIPKAKFTVQAQAFTQDEADMACALIQIDFLRPGLQ